MRQDLEALALASYFAEVTEASAQEGRPARSFSLLLNCLYAIDTLKKPLPLVKAAFELRLLCLTGYEPLLDACAICGEREPPKARLNLSQGILHCARCREQVGGGVSMPLSPGRWRRPGILWGEPQEALFLFVGGGGLEAVGGGDGGLPHDPA